MTQAAVQQGAHMKSELGVHGIAQDSFVRRHIGPSEGEVAEMLSVLGYKNLDTFVADAVPAQIRLKGALQLSRFAHERSESDVIAMLAGMASENKLFRSYIGTGYYGCITPPVIQRNILENPGWYTQYTPYQPEISQGRLEALLNFQTVICDLTGLQIANASLLDESTAAAEAMTMSLALASKNNSTTANKYFVSRDCHPQTISVVETRAEALGIEIALGDPSNTQIDSSYFGALLQYPASTGSIQDYRAFVEKAHAAGAFVAVAADLLALALLTPPGEFGADIAVGSAQRFGVPMGFGGPHAAYFATRDEHKRLMPGRLVGVSKDTRGKPALRLALQTREQHIRREKATSNICTAQVLLAVMASMYAVYHGPEGIKRIAHRVHALTKALADGLTQLGFKLKNQSFFDTLLVDTEGKTKDVLARAHSRKMNLRICDDKTLAISLDEAASEADVLQLLSVFGGDKAPHAVAMDAKTSAIPATLRRTTAFLTNEVFNRYHSETEFLRYIRRLESRDLSLATAMIPLGSCTMKLNATSEMLPVTWKEFGTLHPFAPRDQIKGYEKLFNDLEVALQEITGFDAVSLQPNSGAQGEYAGLLAIRGYHRSRGDTNRTVCLIPKSAHGTNPASAVMAGMEVVVVDCDESGNVDIEDLKRKAVEHSDRLAALMATYPSTHGVFEEGIKEIAEIIHKHGGQVYMDGANLNAQVGLCRPADIGADVCHINLHKTFCIPHGGGGPGMGPIGVRAHLAPFLPDHPVVKLGHTGNVGPVSAAPWGSASILVIPWVYIALMGADGLTLATKIAILNANYIAKRLEGSFPVLYRGKKGLVAHECILDLRNMKKLAGVEVVDVAKRLMDFNFHAPTVSFPVAETLMVEPTESEAKAELDRFCDAMIAIRKEISAIESGAMDRENNPLKNSPHTALDAAATEWTRPYSREQAVFPSPETRESKFWPSVGRIDGSYGDRNLICTCAPIEEYAQK